MAIKTYVDGDSTLTVSDSNTTIIAAGTGTQTVKINAGVTGVTVDGNVEKFTLAGNLSDFKFVNVANVGTQIVNAAGTVVSTIPSLNQNAAVTFSDGTATLAQTATGFTLGGQTVVAGTSATNAAAITSTAMGTGFASTNTLSLTATATPINEGSTVTYTVTAGSAAPTGGLTIPYTLSGTATLTTDYTGASATTGNISIAAGATTGTLTLTAVADNTTEAGAAETVILTLGTLPTGYTLATGAVNTQTTSITDTSLTVSGTSFSLTTAVDNITGTSGDDTIVGLNDANGDTLSVADQINAGNGVDTLNITNTVNGAIDAPVTTGVENVILRSLNNENTAETFTLTSLPGVNSITLKDITDGLTLTNVVLGTSITVTSGLADNAADDVTVTYASATGSSDTASVSTYQSVMQQLVVDSIETLTLTNTGTTATTIASLDTDAATTVNISNSAVLTSGTGLTVTAVGDNVTTRYVLTGTGATKFTGAMSTAMTTIEGGAATGALNLNISTNVNSTTVTLGSGDDRLYVGTVGTNLTAADVTALGSGSNTLVIDDTALTAQDLLDIARVTGVTTLEFASTTVAAAALSSITGLNSFKFGTGAMTGTAGAANSGGNGAAGTAAVTITNMENADALIIASNITGGVGGASTSDGATGGAGAAAILASNLVDGGTNTMTISLTGGVTITGGAGGTSVNSGAGAETGGAAGHGISAATIETLNISSTGSAANAIAGGTGGAATTPGADGNSIVVNSNATINVTGTRDINLGTVSGTNVTINASTFTGKLTVVGEAGNNVIIGGSAADTITGGAGQDQLTGGAGADTFIFASATANTSGGVPSGTVYDIITDYTKGSDIIDFGAALTVEAAASAAAASSGVAQMSQTTGIVTAFNSADNTLALRVTAVEAAIVVGTESAGDFGIFEFSGNSYVLIHDGTSGLANTDVLIQLTGVTGIASAVINASGDLILS